jgi:hypothetical protein
MTGRLPTLFEILISITVVLLLALLCWMTAALHHGNPLAALLIAAILTAIAKLFGTWSQSKFRK